MPNHSWGGTNKKSDLWAYIMFIDTHTHLYTEDFDADRAEVIRRARAAGAVALLLPGLNAESVEPIFRMCREWTGLCYPMLGIHPTEFTPQNAQSQLSALKARLDDPETVKSCVAIGEVGLDFYYPDAPPEALQTALLQEQARWAAHLGLPLMIHSRQAHRQLLTTLLPLEGKLTAGGVFHCFGGTEHEARELLEAFPRFVLGIGGVLTFRNSNLADVLRKAVPPDRIVLETDAPYLAPTPHRGHRNEPAYIPLIIHRLAETYGLEPHEIERLTTQTALSIFPKIHLSTSSAHTSI